MPIIDWVKLADDGSGDLVIRLYEAAGGHAEAMLHLTEAIGGGLIRETDVMEGDGLPEDLPICLESREPMLAQGAHIHLAPVPVGPRCVSRTTDSDMKYAAWRQYWRQYEKAGVRLCPVAVEYNRTLVDAIRFCLQCE